jgi:integrase
MQSQQQKSVNVKVNNINNVSQSIDKYVKLVSRSNKRTGKEYLSRLKQFEEYCISVHNFRLDDLLTSKTVEIDIYELLSGFVSYLVDKNCYGNLTIKYRVITARSLLEYYDMEVSPRKFKFKVIIPKPVVKYKEALTRESILQILENCPSLRLKTYVLFLAATGMRAGEACSIRMMDIDLENRRVHIQGEHTKTKIARWVFLTKELCTSLLSWFEYKYRPRKKYYSYDPQRKHSVKLSEPVIFTPKRSDTDLIFGVEFEKKGQKGSEQYYSTKSLYNRLTVQFDKVLDRLGVGYEDATKQRRKITLHSFRRYVKSTISDLGYSDFSEWYIGHAVSTYYRKSDREKYQLFKRLEESLTYLDQSLLERKHADVISRLEMMESENLNLQKAIHARDEDRKMANATLEQVSKELLQWKQDRDELLKMKQEMEELKRERKQQQQQQNQQ